MVSYLDDGLYFILNMIDNAQNYFTVICADIALLCFVLGLGIDLVKCMGGGEDLSKVLMKNFFALVTYFILMWLFPLFMPWLESLVEKWGYGAVFSEGMELNVHFENGQTKEQFFEWMGEKLSVLKVTETGYTAGDAQKLLNFDITNMETGYLSLNKCFSYGVWQFGIIIESVSSILSLNPKTWIASILGTCVAVFGLYTFVVAIINYITCIVDYHFLQGFGIINIPFTLWNATKSFVETLIGGISKIAVKLLLSTFVVYLCMYTTVYQMISIFTFSGSLSELTDMSVSYFLSCMILKMISTEVTQISGFLSGGQPGLSFGEFAAAARTTATNTASAMGAYATGAKVGGAMAAAGGAVAAGAVTGSDAASFAKENGASTAQAVAGGLGTGIKTALRPAGEKLKGLAADTAADISEGKLGGKVGSAISGAAEHVAENLGMTRAGSKREGSLFGSGEEGANATREGGPLASPENMNGVGGTVAGEFNNKGIMEGIYGRSSGADDAENRLTASANRHAESLNPLRRAQAFAESAISDSMTASKAGLGREGVADAIRDNFNKWKQNEHKQMHQSFKSEMEKPEGVE